MIAVAANTEGPREIIGLSIGPSEAETFRTEFLRSLRARGFCGVRLVISDAYTGFEAAIARIFEATWQRCRIHWMQNVLTHVSRGRHTVVAAAIRQAFDQPDRAQAGTRCSPCGPAQPRCGGCAEAELSGAARAAGLVFLRRDGRDHHYGLDLDLHRFCSGKVLMLSGLLFESHG